MPQQCRNDEGVHASLQEPGGECVTEVVRPQVFDSGSRVQALVNPVFIALIGSSSRFANK